VAAQIGDPIETVFGHYTYVLREAQLASRSMSFEAAIWAAREDVWGSDGETSVRGVCALDESAEQMSPFGGPETNQMQASQETREAGLEPATFGFVAPSSPL